MKKSIVLKTIMILLLFIPFHLISQELYAGIEIGGKGIKMSIIKVRNVKKGKYKVQDFWTENIAIAKGIALDGKLAINDIETANNAVIANYNKIANEYKVEKSKIFIVVSSGVGMAKNVDVLLQKLNQLTNKKVEIISSQKEAKLLLKGCIPPKYYLNSFIMDIGGGNTKGGYVEKVNNDNGALFCPLTLDLGTITVTEKINKNAKTKSISEFIALLFNYLPELRKQTDRLYQQSPDIFNKPNIYMSGGAVWAFYTLYNRSVATDNFDSFDIKDVMAYDNSIKFDYAKFEALALKNTEIDNVLKTYSQKNLITANAILLTLLEKIPDVKSKNIYFAKQGQMAWLLSNIADSEKNAKVIR